MILTDTVWINLLGATGGKDSVSLAEGDSGLLSAGGSKKGLQTLCERAAGSIIVLHCPVLDLLVKANTTPGYFSALITILFQKTYLYIAILSICKNSVMSILK